MGLFDNIMSIGQKVSGLVGRGLSFGKKLVGNVDKISKKVKSVASFASRVPFLPDSVKNVLSKVGTVTGQVDKGSALLKKGISATESLKKAAEGSRSVSDVINVGKRAFYGGKNVISAGTTFANSTRAALKRPTGKDNVSRQKSLQPVLPAGIKLAKRALVEVGSSIAKRGISRPENADFQKALLAAQQARKMMSGMSKKRRGRK
jgi:hypothetical protein